MRGIQVMRRIGAAASTVGNNLAVAAGFAERHKNYRRFIVVAPPRSGSTVLSWTLANHPAIVSYGELFNSTSIGWDQESPPPLVRSSYLDRLRQESPTEFLKKHIWCERPISIQAVGLKIVYGQILLLKKSSLTEFLSNERAVAIIHLVRKSLLRSYLSVEKSRHTGIYHIDSKFGGYVDRPVMLDPQAVVQYIKGMRRWRVLVDNLFDGHDLHRLEYGAMVNNWNISLKGVFDFLEVPRLDLEPAINRLSSLSLEESIKNYEAVVKNLIDSGLESEILDDSPVQ